MSPVSYDPDHPPVIVERDELAVTDRVPPRITGSDMAGQPLSPREFQILQLVAKGATLKQAAAECGLALHTVRSYVRSILAKTRAATLRRAVVLYTIYAAGQ